MSQPVYGFGRILRELRRDVGLTILAAAEATGYGKYERWESGQTKVGTQYLATVAGAFGIDDELYLLIYAWLLDRLSPRVGEPSRTLDLETLRRALRDVPGTTVLLGDHEKPAAEPARHVDVALFLLAAQHGAKASWSCRRQTGRHYRRQLGACRSSPISTGRRSPTVSPSSGSVSSLADLTGTTTP